jgi:hypothetical protein
MRAGMFLIASLFIATLVIGTDISFAQKKKQVTMHGQIVDVNGFTESIEWDAETMKKAAKDGHQLGFYNTKTKRLYVITLDDKDKEVNSVLLPYVGERIWVKGTRFVKDEANYLILSSIGKLNK